MIEAHGYQYTPDDLRGTIAGFGESWRDIAAQRDAAMSRRFGWRLAEALANHLGESNSGGDGDPGEVIDRLAEAAWRRFTGDLADVGEREASARLLADGLTAIDAFAAALRDAGEMPARTEGSVVQLSRSGGGIPKTAVAEVEVELDGVVGDRQATRRHHGRPPQALCLWSAEVIDAFADDGHPIGYGSAGENVTIAGLDWAEVRPGVRLEIGEVLAEVSWYAHPCSQNARWFRDGDFNTMNAARGPVSRVYAWVRRPGTIRAGDTVILEP